MNLYEIINNSGFDFTDESMRLWKIFKEHRIFTSGMYESIEEYINGFFRKLKISNTCLNIEDFLSKYQFDQYYDYYNTCEFISTLLYQSKEYLLHDTANEIATELIENIEIGLSQTNHKLKLDENLDMFFVVEDNELTTIAIEATDNKELNLSLLRYNHYLTAGNIDKKKEILNQISPKIEKEIAESGIINSKFENVAKDTKFLLNSLNIRHDNISAKKNDFYKYAQDDGIENWYDITYTSVLVTLVLISYLPTIEKITTLKQIKN